MSALTKIFVTLLIVGSLLLTTATVVFVQKTEDYKLAADNAKASLALAEKQREAEAARAYAAQLREQQAVARTMQLVSEKMADLKKFEEQLAERTTQIAKQNQDLAVLRAATGEQASALKTKEENLAALQRRNETLVTENGKIVIANAEQTGRIADLEKQVAQSERERRWLNEQIAQLKQDLSQANSTLASHDIRLGDTPAPRPADIKGAIEDVQIKDGMAYAMINVGAADKVQKGMQFTVVDQTSGQFLGFLMVDSVDQNTAFGRLEGPRIEQVKQNHQVLSQL